MSSELKPVPCPVLVIADGGGSGAESKRRALGRMALFGDIKSVVGVSAVEILELAWNPPAACMDGGTSNCVCVCELKV